MHRCAGGIMPARATRETRSSIFRGCVPEASRLVTGDWADLRGWLLDVQLSETRSVHALLVACFGSWLTNPGGLQSCTEHCCKHSDSAKEPR